MAKGNFCGFVLLLDDRWDLKKLLADLKSEWGIEIPEEDVDWEEGKTIVTELSGHHVAISRFPVPIPEGEAELNAKNNFLWREAEEVTKKHQAHIVVAILGEGDVIEKGMLYAKIMAACSMQENAIGVFTNGVVYEPSHYIMTTEPAKEGGLPVLSWVWFCLYSEDGKLFNGYTYGLEEFGKRELEIVRSNENGEKIMDFLIAMSAYVIGEDVELQDGETIGLSADDIHTITLSKGVALPDQQTLKIGFQKPEEKKKSGWKFW